MQAAERLLWWYEGLLLDVWGRKAPSKAGNWEGWSQEGENQEGKIGWSSCSLTRRP